MYRFHVKWLCISEQNIPPQFIIMNVFISSNRNQSTCLTCECTCYQENFEGGKSILYRTITLHVSIFKQKNRMIQVFYIKTQCYVQEVNFYMLGTRALGHSFCGKTEL